MNALSIILLIAIFIQALIMLEFDKDIKDLKKQVSALHVILHKKFNITVTEIVENLCEYQEKDIDFFK